MALSLLLFLCFKFVHGLPVADQIVYNNILPKYMDIININQASNLDLFEGDIKIDKKNVRNTLIGNQYRWPLTVPYYLEDGLDMNAKGVILKAFERYRLKTCINFTPWNGEKNYISVFKDNGCYSYVGNLQWGKQQLSIGSGCDTVEIVQHELLHALGFYHEHSRSDRDDYLYIVMENVQPGKEHNFKRYDDAETSFLNVPYDYTSIMHYEKTAFQKNSNPTMIPKKLQYTNIIGKQTDLSDSDVLKLNQLYNCSFSLTFLDSCSFEIDDICGMLQSSSDSSDWQRVTNVPTGPSSDHTTLGNENDSGYFMHFTTRTGVTGDAAVLESRLFYPVRAFQCLEFFYYHNGNENDRLNIWIKEYTAGSPSGSLKLMDSIHGKPAEHWQPHYSSLNSTHKYRFVFEGVKGIGISTGGFSIDDINLSETECPQNIWHIENFSQTLSKSAVYSPPYYSKDGYAYQIVLAKYIMQDSIGIAAFLYLISGANDNYLQWPCSWRQATIEFLDKYPKAQQRTSSMKSITTDPSLRADDSSLVWDNPEIVGSTNRFPNGTVYKMSGGYGRLLFTSEEWLYRRDFLKGGDAFILISMDDISHLKQSQPLPKPTIPPPKVPELPELCKENICQNNGLCVVEDSNLVCRCITSGDWWYVGERCEKRVSSEGHMWTMSSLSPLLIALLTISLINTA